MDTQKEITARATEKALRELLTLDPADSVTHHAYAQFLTEQQRREEAVMHYREAIRFQPDFREAFRNLAALYSSQRNFPEAITLLRQAIAARPDDVQSLCDLGNALVKARQADQAIPILQHALRLAPLEPALHNNLGLAFMRWGLFENAEESFQEALRLQPMFVSAHNNLGTLYITMGHFGQAFACFDLAGIIDPNNVNTKCNRALALLATGDFERGWREYEWRWQRPESPHRPYVQPLWKGEPLEGRRILIYTEEGLGDRIQFVRYAQKVQAQGGHVLLECPMPLMDVLRNAAGIDELIPMGESPPLFDVHVPLLSLPHWCGAILENIPAKVPYLFAEPERIALWQSRFARNASAGEFLIGIAWQGNPHHEWDRFRSMPLMQFEPLTRIPGIRLISLQRGPGIEQINAFQNFTGGHLMVPTDGQQTASAALADTAAIMTTLDLIVTVDTATAHLAGALGRPVWVVLSRVTDWRWMTNRTDTPWYPTMRLFRQKQQGDWQEVIARIKECLPISAAS